MPTGVPRQLSAVVVRMPGTSGFSLYETTDTSSEKTPCITPSAAGVRLRVLARLVLSEIRSAVERGWRAVLELSTKAKGWERERRAGVDVR